MLPQNFLWTKRHFLWLVKKQISVFQMTFYEMFFVFYRWHKNVFFSFCWTLCMNIECPNVHLFPDFFLTFWCTFLAVGAYSPMSQNGFPLLLPSSEYSFKLLYLRNFSPWYSSLLGNAWGDDRCYKLPEWLWGVEQMENTKLDMIVDDFLRALYIIPI